MKRLLLFLVFICITLAGYSQDRQNSVKTNTESGRWEVIQSPILRKLTIKLDKFTGKTYQLVSTSGDNVEWEEIYWNGQANVKDYNTINYQIYMSGIMARDSFLVNIQTGETWRLITYGPYEKLYWEFVFVE